jgi:hypothetical protein
VIHNQHERVVLARRGPRLGHERQAVAVEVLRKPHRTAILDHGGTERCEVLGNRL